MMESEEKVRIFVHEEVSKEPSLTLALKEETKLSVTLSLCDKVHNLADCQRFQAKSRNVGS